MPEYTVRAWAEFEGEIEDIRGALDDAIAQAGGSGLFAEDEAGARVNLEFRLAADSANAATELIDEILRSVFPDAERGVVSVDR
jgi:hypothetical protein